MKVLIKRDKLSVSVIVRIDFHTFLDDKLALQMSLMHTLAVFSVFVLNSPRQFGRRLMILIVNRNSQANVQRQGKNGTREKFHGSKQATSEELSTSPGKISLVDCP
jgi:hypothetical protein